MNFKITAALLLLALALTWMLLERGPHRASSTAQPPPHAANPPAVASNGLARAPSIPVNPSPSSPATLASAPQAIEEPAFAAFADWTRRFAAAPPTPPAALEAEGVALARARLNALADLIQVNPERALALAISPPARRAMPASVQALLEKHIDARGDYQVVCVLPPPGQRTQGPPIVRSATIGGQTLQVFTYGPALAYVTRQDIPLRGIAVPVTAATRPPVDLIGLRPVQFMALAPDPFTAAAALDTPPAPGDLPAEASSYTEGRKRFLVLRVDFPDYPSEALTTNNALNLMRDLGAFMAEISYYKHIVAPVGQGSDITPTMRMSNNVAAYDNAGLSVLYPEAKQAAQDVYQYDLAQYDFLFVVTGARPAYGYAGLGYVGGVGFHLANSYFDVRTSAHEFGHNLGLSHANWWNTGDRSALGEGTSEEYGDPFDTMGGSGGGILHFSSYNKNRLGWIPNTDCATAATNGVYRLYAQDIAAAPVGLRGLRLPRSGGDYWLEFRQLWTGNKALMNGLSVRWVNNSTILLDMNPGSAAGKDDHPLTIGRTFSDPALNFYVTPLGKAHTYPEAMDVAVNFGPVPTNRHPTVVVKANTTAAVLGQPIAFTAAAADPNNDRLAFAWDFGDGDYSTDNRPAATHSFGAAGEYYVACTVSDMKGGLARDALMVSVGSPATFTISGHILKGNGQPLPGMRVSVDKSHYAVTAGDGTYAITSLAPGAYTISAIDPLADKYTFLQPFFTNPVSVGPDFATADFLGSTNSMNLYTPLAPKLSAWRYLDDGSNQGTNWVKPSFADTAWPSGAAILGYDQGNETTTLHYGSDANNKYITYYFRKRFSVTNPAAFTNLLLEVLRDDGVIVYLNGAEIYRNNMPTNVAITYTTLAVDGIEPDAYLRQTLPVSVLATGQNVLAAEIHQAEPTSSDINFDLALSGLSISNATGLSLVYVVSPADQEQFTHPTNLALRAFAQSSAGPVSQVAFYTDGALLGTDSTAPYTQTWNNPGLGAHSISVVATVGLNQVTSAPVIVTVADPVAIPPPVSLGLIATGSVWKYFTGPTGAPATWNRSDFNDAAWASGRAHLGYGEGDEATVLSYGGNANSKWISAYFRRAFQIPDPAAVTDLTLRLERDDGAVVYLNGQEILRDNMPQGPVTYATLASSAASDDGATFNFFALDPLALAVGTNVLAVEIHQSAANSSDLSFDLALDGLAWTNRARGLWLTSPADGAAVASPGSVALAADAVAGGRLGIRQVAFYADGQLLGAAAGRPYSLTWRDPPGGLAHELVAVATDSSGLTLTSAPVTIQVGVPRPPTELVSFGELWKYRDDGSNQGAAWSARTFDDRAWKAGAAPLGYGGTGLETTISYGTNSAHRHITAYFRKQFAVPDPRAFTNLLLELVCQDAAAVYLNGVEICRTNLAPGLISFNSLALASATAPAAAAPKELWVDPRLLRTGTNCLAVELHQAAITTPAARFDLALTALAPTNLALGIYCVSPADATRYDAPAKIDLAAYVVSGGDPVTLVEYLSGGTVVGAASVNPYSFAWSNVPPGSYTLVARATCAQGSTFTSPPVTVTVGPPPPPISPVFTTLLPALSQWKYWDNSAPVTFGWERPGFDDAAWPRSAARFGFGYDGEVTHLTEGRVTWYFRRWFNVSNPALFTQLVFQLARDDGAVVYVNGHEVFRSNMPDGPVAPDTLATTTVETPDETTYFETTLPAVAVGLLCGSNLVTVELHQAAPTSSDAGFDLQLVGFGTTESRIYLTEPTDGAAYGTVAALELEAAVSPGEGQAVEQVEFLVNGVPRAATAVAPYRWSWPQPGFGPQRVSARATLAGGALLETAPADITLGREPVATLLIPSNSVWKFLDNGSNQGTNWAQPKYADTAWRSGPARLGYGNKGEVTPVGFGSNPNTKFITTYFRRTFVVPEGAFYTNLLLKLVRDDGAVIWLNGRPLFRSNMPLPAAVPVVGYTTPASNTVSGVDEQTFFTSSVSIANLPPGTNLLAVEIHQINGTSSDIGFNLELSASGYHDELLPPTLSAALADGFLELSWPATAGPWIVISTLAPRGPWSAVDIQPVLVNARYLVTVPMPDSVRFFRLVKP